MVFVDIEIETSKERSDYRYMNGLNEYVEGKNMLGGRYVPESVFEACKPTWEGTSSKNQEVFRTIQMDKRLPIKTIEYDNNEFGRGPIRIS